MTKWRPITRRATPSTTPGEDAHVNQVRPTANGTAFASQKNGLCPHPRLDSTNNTTIKPIVVEEVRPLVDEDDDDLKAPPPLPPRTAIMDEDLDDEEDAQCGIGSLQPQWLQGLAKKEVFLAVFCLASVLQGMYHTYFVSVLTTIEKLFQIQSKTTGIIMSATEMGQIGGALLLTYYGGQGHRPKWIACGLLLFAFASFLCSLPHFLYGAELSRNLLHNMNEYNNSTVRVEANLCLASNGSLGSHLWTEGINVTIPPSSYSSPSCHEAEPGKQGRITNMVLGIFFVSLLFIGIGSTAVYTLGIPYIDDNVANRDSPLYFAITIGVKILGPVFGFLLGSLCTSLYVNPFEESGITNKDPRWIGAWWLGLFIVAGSLLVASVAMFAFPRRLRGQRRLKANGHVHPMNNSTTTTSITTATAETNSTASDSALMIKKVDGSAQPKPSLRDFPVAMRRLLKNDILLCRTASSVLHILPIAGLYTFLPKYLESQFRLTATAANLFSGIAGILVMGIGIFASGTYMRLFKPNARFVAGWIAVTALAYSIGMALLMFVGCPVKDFAGLHETGSGLQVAPPCNTSCECNREIFAPVCTTDGSTYYSACYAGCHSMVVKEANQQIYHDCECLKPNVTATYGYCQIECNNFLLYICIFSVFVLIHSTSEVGSMLLTLRCVDPKDKAMALGLISFAIGLFGNVPCPIIYGAVVDSACIVWEYTCGQQGACWFYDPSVFRMFFHGMTGAIMFLAFIVDVVVWYKATNIHFSDEDPPHANGEEPSSSHFTQFETTV